METRFLFECPLCGNKDPKFIGYLNGKPYCRKCISFNGRIVKRNYVEEKYSPAVLDYELSVEQETIAEQVKENYVNGLNTLIHAVCGAGKTELVYASISEALNRGEQVGFAVPRRDVVIELYPRIKKAYPNRTVIEVYGGHNEDLTADIIVLTTHQLYRYERFFDLLIVDEIDAYPFANNDVLISIFHRSIRRNFIMMSATPSKEVIEYFSKNDNQIIKLYTRYHKMPLPVPMIINSLGIFKLDILFSKVKQFIKQGKPVMVFTPTIEICEEIYRYLHVFLKSGTYVHSKCKDRNLRIDEFKNGVKKYIVCTSILERGITVKNVQVIIYGSDHKIYKKGTLIQISGRVGRKIGATSGEVIFLANKTTNDMKDAINEIIEDNKHLQT